MRKKRIYLIVSLWIGVLLYFLSVDLYSSDGHIPNFAIYDTQGNRYVFYDILNMLSDDGILILNFTSIHCQPCKKEIPELLSIANETTSCKLMCVYTEVGSEARGSAEKLGVSKQAFVDPFGNIRMKIFQKERIKIPTTLLVDKNRALIKTFTGYSRENIEGIRECIDSR